MCLVGVLLGVCLSSGRAHAGGALVRWLPSPDPGTVGYRAYVRQSGTPYGAPVDVFVPPLGADGTMSYVTLGLTSGITYYFGVTAYGADGTESGFSAELPLGPISRCAIDTCVAPIVCSFGPVADGTSCSDSDPCTVCRGGACTAQPARALTTKKLNFSTAPTGTRMRAVGDYVPTAAFDPTLTGIRIELAGAAGAAFYRAVVPPGAFTSYAGGTSFRVRFPGLVDGAPGLRHLKLRLRQGTVLVNLQATAPALDAARTLPRLVWLLQLGADECVRDATLTCTARGFGSACL